MEHKINACFRARGLPCQLNSGGGMPDSLHSRAHSLFGLHGMVLFTTSVDNAHMCEPSSSQPGWLEQVESQSNLIYRPVRALDRTVLLHRS